MAYPGQALAEPGASGAATAAAAVGVRVGVGALGEVSEMHEVGEVSVKATTCDSRNPPSCNDPDAHIGWQSMDNCPSSGTIRNCKRE